MAGKRQSSVPKPVVVDDSSDSVLTGPQSLSVLDLGAEVDELPRVDRVWVRVEVSHDGLYAGQVHEVAFSERVKALIRNGYLEVVAPPDGIWPV